MATMEERFDLLMNPPKMLKARMIVAALPPIAAFATATHAQWQRVSNC